MHMPVLTERMALYGIDNHDALVPGPAQVPAMPHDVMTLLGGDAAHTATTVFIHGKAVLCRDHTTSHAVHVPFGPNLLTPVVIALATSKLMLSAHEVIVQDQPIAYGPCGILGCADPVAFPTQSAIPITDVFVKARPMHLARAAACWALEVAWDKLAEAAFAGLGHLLGQGSRKLVDRLCDIAPKPMLVVGLAEAAVRQHLRDPARLVRMMAERLLGPVEETASRALGRRAADIAVEQLARAAEDKTLHALVGAVTEEVLGQQLDAAAESLAALVGADKESLEAEVDGVLGTG